MIKSFILFSILFVNIKGDLNLCTNGNATSEAVIHYCTSINGSLEYRCCYQMNTRYLLGIDLTEMNLNRVPNLSESINLTVIDLRLNPSLQSSKSEDFIGLKSLDYLLLPEQYPCPGDKDVWYIINHSDNPNGIICQHQKDFCRNSTNMCLSPNANCVLNGPNHFLCLCKYGYYGYKCLRSGEFPTGKFFGSVICIVTVLSAFFYCTHRRHVKKD